MCATHFPRPKIFFTPHASNRSPLTAHLRSFLLATPPNPSTLLANSLLPRAPPHHPTVLPSLPPPTPPPPTLPTKRTQAVSPEPARPPNPQFRHRTHTYPKKYYNITPKFEPTPINLHSLLLANTRASQPLLERNAQPHGRIPWTNITSPPLPHTQKPLFT